MELWRYWGCWGNHQGLSYVLEIIRTELIGRYHDEDTLALRRLENSLPGKNTRPAVAPDTCPSLKGLGRDCLYLPIGRTQATIWFSSSLIGLRKWYTTSWCRQQLMHPGWQKSYRRHRLSPRSPRLNHERQEEVEAMKEIGLNGENHNYLRPLLVEILKVYKIEPFLMELAALCLFTSVDYFIYKGGGWWIMIFFDFRFSMSRLIKNWSSIKNGYSLGEGNYQKISMHALIGY